MVFIFFNQPLHMLKYYKNSAKKTFYEEKVFAIVYNINISKVYAVVHKKKQKFNDDTKE